MICCRLWSPVLDQNLGVDSYLYKCLQSYEQCTYITYMLICQRSQRWQNFCPPPPHPPPPLLNSYLSFPCLLQQPFRVFSFELCCLTVHRDCLVEVPMPAKLFLPLSSEKKHFAEAHIHVCIAGPLSTEDKRFADVSMPAKSFLTLSTE